MVIDKAFILTYIDYYYVLLTLFGKINFINTYYFLIAGIINY